MRLRRTVGLGTILLAICLAALAQPARAQFVGSDPVVQPFCAVYNNPALKPAAEWLCDGRLLRTFAGFANEMVAFKKMLPLVAVECGQPSAFFDRTKGAIFVCYEFAKEVLDRTASEAVPGATSRVQVATGALLFAVAHELGHGAFHLHRLETAGPEETAADQVAALYMTRAADQAPDSAKDWALGADWLFRNRLRLYAPGHFPAAPPVDPQRLLDVACWIYGSHPDRYPVLAQSAPLPAGRAPQCAVEYRQMADAVRQRLASQLKR